MMKCSVTVNRDLAKLKMKYYSVVLHALQSTSSDQSIIC